jgi:putative transposase
MIDATHKLPLKRQAALLDLSRSNAYYLLRPVADGDLVLMRRIDELHLNFPYAGACMLRDMLKLEGVEVGRKHVRTLMERIGIAAIYRKRNTIMPHPAHPIYPYLTRITLRTKRHRK